MGTIRLAVVQPRTLRPQENANVERAAGYARQYGLRAAAEAGEEVRLDEAGEDLHIAGGNVTVEPYLVPA